MNHPQASQYHQEPIFFISKIRKFISDEVSVQQSGMGAQSGLDDVNMSATPRGSSTVIQIGEHMMSWDRLKSIRFLQLTR